MAGQKQQLGRYTKICSMRKGQPFLMIGPNRICFLLFFLAFNIVSAIMLFLLTKNSEAYVFFIVHLVILIYLDVSWLATVLINPGIILKSSHDEYGCAYCKNNYPSDYQELCIMQHCKKCQICIEGRAHHCAMTGGCIGTGNQISYYFFLLGLVLWSVDFITTAPYVYYLK